MKTVQVSLKGLGYVSACALVTVRETVETGDIFPILEGLPTLECVSVRLEAIEDSPNAAYHAEKAAFSIVLGRFLGSYGVSPVSFEKL